jgi:hypothetical protein
VRGVFGGLAALALGLTAGCDSAPDRVETHPVSGQVLYDGKAAAGVRVFLIPTSAPAPPDVPSNPYGVTGPDGRFTLSTFGDGDGAAEGGYQVVFFWPAETKEDEEESDEDQLFGWYSAVNSKIAIEVKTGDNALQPFNLPFRKGPPPKSEGVPGRN